jgi:hypothetical protein
LAGRIQADPASAGGIAVKVNVRSPYTVLPTCRFDCTDQSAAFTESLTDNPDICTDPPDDELVDDELVIELDEALEELPDDPVATLIPYKQ